MSGESRISKLPSQWLTFSGACKRQSRLKMMVLDVLLWSSMVRGSKFWQAQENYGIYQCVKLHSCLTIGILTFLLYGVWTESEKYYQALCAVKYTAPSSAFLCIAGYQLPGRSTGVFSTARDVLTYQVHSNIHSTESATTPQDYSKGHVDFYGDKLKNKAVVRTEWRSQMRQFLAHNEMGSDVQSGVLELELSEAALLEFSTCIWKHPVKRTSQCNPTHFQALHSYNTKYTN